MIERDRQPHPSASGRALFQNSTAVKAMARRLKTNEGAISTPSVNRRRNVKRMFALDLG